MRDTLTTYPSASLAIGGLLIGVALGAIVFRTNFCAMGSISDMVSLGDRRRFRAWVLAGAVGIFGTQWLNLSGVVDLSKSMYLAPSLNWSGNLIGGALFGFGMVFGGGCASRNLARVGGGDLRSLLTLIVLGIAAYAAMTGVLGPARVAFDQATAIALTGVGATSQSLPDIAAALFNSNLASNKVAVTAIVLAIMLAYCLKDASFRASPVHLISGIGVGLCIVAGWALTGLTFDEFAEKPTVPASLTFVRPTGDTLEWLQRATGLGAPGFAVMSVFGTILGAFMMALATRQFRITTFSDKSDTLRHLGGAVLMGVGGIMALGCTIGQGITGVSTLALGSFLTFTGLVAGAASGVRVFERMLMRED